MITCSTFGDANVDFEVVNDPLHDGSDSIGFKPFFGVPLGPGGHTQIHMFVGIGSSAIFWPPFDPICPSLFFGDTKMFHIKGRVIRAGGIAISIETNLFEWTFISRIERDQCRRITVGLIFIRRIGLLLTP